MAARTRTTILSLLPILLVWLNRFRGLTLGSAVALTAVAVVVYSPWPIRNSLLLGQFIPGSATTGFNYPSSWPALYHAWYATVLLFSAAGVWWSWRDPAARSVIILVLGAPIFVSVMQAFFYVEGRHRLAIEPLLLVLAGVGFVRSRMGLGKQNRMWLVAEKFNFPAPQ